MIEINEHIILDEKELKEEFIRSSGPGGQNVNKVSTAVQLRFNVLASKSLSEGQKKRLCSLAAGRINSEGELIVRAGSSRSQWKNRRKAFEKLKELLIKASLIPKKRKRVKPTLADKGRRLDAKKKRGEIKGLRRKIFKA